jgi:stage III sporulation protein SpoIIIAA
MENMMSNNNTINTPPPPPETKLMILIGNPGVGKSAMVRTLAREMNIQILAWNDAHVEYNTNIVDNPFAISSGYLQQMVPHAEFATEVRTNSLQC